MSINMNDTIQKMQFIYHYDYFSTIRKGTFSQTINITLYSNTTHSNVMTIPWLSAQCCPLEVHSCHCSQWPCSGTRIPVLPSPTHNGRGSSGSWGWAPATRHGRAAWRHLSDTDSLLDLRWEWHTSALRSGMCWGRGGAPRACRSVLRAWLTGWLTDRWHWRSWESWGSHPHRQRGRGRGRPAGLCAAHTGRLQTHAAAGIYSGSAISQTMEKEKLGNWQGGVDSCNGDQDVI